MEPKEKVENLFKTFYSHVKEPGNKFPASDKMETAKKNTIFAIVTVLSAIEHEDNRMYFEIKFWKECLTIAEAL